MRTFIKKISLAISTFAILSLGFTPLAYAQKADVCEGVGIVSGTGSCTAPANSPDLQTTIRRVIAVLSIVVGIIAVIMIIIGGLRYITSGGDSSSTAGAKNTILYAVIGLVVAAMAQVIVRYVLSQV